jgi:hypothetical protein
MCGHIFTIFERGPQYLELGERPSRLRGRGIASKVCSVAHRAGCSLDEGRGVGRCDVVVARRNFGSYFDQSSRCRVDLGPKNSGHQPQMSTFGHMSTGSLTQSRDPYRSHLTLFRESSATVLIDM